MHDSCQTFMLFLADIKTVFINSLVFVCFIKYNEKKKKTLRGRSARA